MNVKNQINKRVVKELRRMFFQLHNDSSKPVAGKLLLEIKGLTQTGNYKVEIKPIAAKSFGFVYVDVPKELFAQANGFVWAWQGLQEKGGRTPQWTGKGMLTDKFEDLYEGN